MCGHPVLLIHGRSKNVRAADVERRGTTRPEIVAARLSVDLLGCRAALHRNKSAQEADVIVNSTCRARPLTAILLRHCAWLERLRDKPPRPAGDDQRSPAAAGRTVDGNRDIRGGHDAYRSRPDPPAPLTDRITECDYLMTPRRMARRTSSAVLWISSFSRM